MLGWILRFCYNITHSDNKKSGELSAAEFTAAETLAFKLIQQECFSGEDDKSISNLQPFYDEKRVLRLKSRVSNREDTEYFRFPVILPAKHPLVQSLIWFEHTKSCHVRTQGLLSLLREKYWILGGRRSIRSVISRCVVCKRQHGKPLVVQSPPLPLDRVRLAVPFEITGVDFAGPLFLRTGQKVWLCLFTCAVYRAVHLELCTSLSTAGFLQVFRRFVARRGRPKKIYSDNGTNFVGAENALSALDWDSILRETSVQRIVWKFNPPTAAWWGGFWERLIGVLKQLLRKMLGHACLDFEQLLTLVCDCEAVVNARPLTYCSEDSTDLAPLTPSLFLREQTDWGLPDCDSVDRASLCRKARHIQRLRDDLRARFRTEYMGQLKLLSKNAKCSPVRIGDVVLIGNDNSKRTDWPMGKVSELLSGKDGQVRLVRLETPRGELLRPLQRLYPLECITMERDVEATPGPESTTPEAFQDSEEASGRTEDVLNRSAEAVKVTRCGRVSKIPARYL
ncbi:uncharacterized protein LOC126743323 [Anthonomus grandis grandis]|uniref:uncharacterized protein LOC126743323 n=1 Tax=Anthonomus grandis grandis TaxID=2921223 RepID=UPI0021653189|nr:uncharacterized protein LOC126743323 [Anthonomus grandis grandis]